MKDTLSVCLVQPDIHWESPEANRAELEEMLSEIKDDTDLIVLPETFSTGFTAKAKEFAEPMNFNSHKWMKQMAAKHNSAICGSLLIQEGENVYNRLLFVKPNGDTHKYDKKHLFSMGNEGKQFSPGREILTVSWKGWRIRPFICYDLRFPVWSRNTPVHYDLGIYVTNWPQPRMEIYTTLLKARAIENQVYILGTNRIGTDGNGIIYSGQTQAIDPKGIIIDQMQSNPGLLQVHLSRRSLDQFRESFPVAKDADPFSLEN